MSTNKGISSERNKGNRSIGFEEMKTIEPDLNFLFVAHNEYEDCIFRKYLKPMSGYKSILKYVDNNGNKQTYLIGMIGAQCVVYTKTADMGSINVNAAINVINNAIDLWRPRFVIMVGIAAGMNGKADIGNVIISQKIIGYESEKVVNGSYIGRYPEFKPIRLFNLFDSIETVYCKKELRIEDCTEKHIDETIPQPKIVKGPVISGEKLLNDPCMKGELEIKFPEAVALDMESIGMTTACINKGVYDWIMIKGISDEGVNKDKNEKCYQKAAMENVMRVVEWVFSDPHAFSMNEMKYSPYRVVKSNIFISGTLKGHEKSFIRDSQKFVSSLSEKLLVEKYKIITGMGENLGESVIMGVFEFLNRSRLEKQRKYSDCVVPFEFPHTDENEESEGYIRMKYDSYKHRNREMMCKEASTALFIFGRSPSMNNYNVDGVGSGFTTSGMAMEFDIAYREGLLIVPIGSTGHHAEAIWNIVGENYEKYYSEYPRIMEEGHHLFEKLRSIDYLEQSDELIEVILEFISLGRDKVIP